MKWFIKCLKQYADFNGRARRSEYWWFTLINFIITVVLLIGWMVPLFKMAIHSEDLPDEWELLRVMFSNPFIYIYLIYYLAMLIPSLAVTVRRLHDIGKSGFWVFLSIGSSLLFSIARGINGMNLTSTPNISIAISIVIELIAIAIAILFLVCMFIDSQPGENKWGPNPKEPTQIETTE